MLKALAVALIVLATAGSGGAQSISLAGSWKLISYQTVTPQGTRTFPLGADAVGLLIYLPNGRMSVQFMKRDRPLFTSGDAWRGTLEEERAAFEGFFSYAGRYTFDAARGIVTHHIEIAAAPNYVGTDLVRTISVSGNRATLSTPQRTLAGGTGSSVLVWERVD